MAVAPAGTDTERRVLLGILENLTSGKEIEEWLDRCMCRVVIM